MTMICFRAGPLAFLPQCPWCPPRAGANRQKLCVRLPSW
jgi:hypothetical protein